MVFITIPLLKNYQQINYTTAKEPIINNLKRVLTSIKNNKRYSSSLSHSFYIDGVYTIIEMATSYGKMLELMIIVYY
ncbi:MAG: hypothetical protein ACLRQF_00520 [Thomasclavelia ramosa]